MTEPTVHIIDDDPSARRGLVLVVRAAGMRTESYASAGEFLASGRWAGPGCIVLDVRMPQMTGPELQVELNEADSYMPIIFLSAHGDVPMAAQAMKQGAVDFLEKPVDQDDLLGAIRVALSRDAEEQAYRAETSAVQTRLQSLTPREFEIMTYVITGMLNKQIALELNISEKTVKIHRGRLMQKLEVVSVAELVRLCEFTGISPAASQRK